MIKREFVDPEFIELVDANNEELLFENLWSREDPWFEEPNIGRRDSKKAWSGVSRIIFKGNTFFLKKQENYFSYSVQPPLRQLLVEKEYSNIQLFKSYNIPCLDFVYFGVRKMPGGILGKTQGILITKALDNYLPLDKVQANFWEAQGAEYQTIRKAIITSLAALVAQTHKSGLMHRCLYPKHIYIDKDFCETGEQKTFDPVCRFIDLESARKMPYKSTKQLRDLETLNRRSPSTSLGDKLYFLLKYLNKNRLDKDVRQLIERIKKISRV